MLVARERYHRVVLKTVKMNRFIDEEDQDDKLLISKNLFIRTKPFVFNIPDISKDVPVYGLLSTDGYGTLGIRILFSSHQGVTPSIQLLASKISKNLLNDPLSVTDNEFCCYGVLTQPTPQIELLNSLECVVRMDRFRLIVLEMISLG